jgi:hypothetical protein
MGITIREARTRAFAKLEDEGWRYDQIQAGFAHPDGRSGRLAYWPDKDNSDLVTSVSLRPPTKGGTIPPFIPVLDNL